MKKKEDYMLYIFNLIVLSLISLISFKGVIISTLAYILTCDIIKSR
jgi:hypothetical protein